MPEVVQLLWIHLEEPEPSDEILDSSHTRVWYHATARDASGSALAGMPQRNAFKLTGATGFPDFCDKHQQGTLNTPLFCHARLSRTLRAKTSGASQPGASQEASFVNMVIEDIEPVSWNPASAPNAAYNDVLHILNNCPRHDEGVLFAYLADIKHDPYYGFQVAYDGADSVKAKFVAALISSPNRSETVGVGSGYKVTTPGIIDFANPGASQPGLFNVMGFCGMNDILNFKLDPPRGKSSRVAVVLISKADAEGFQVHKLEHIEPTDSDNAVACFRKLRHLCQKIHPKATEKRSHALGHVFASKPPGIKRCRTLQVMPTDASL